MPVTLSAKSSAALGLSLALFIAGGFALGFSERYGLFIRLAGFVGLALAVLLLWYTMAVQLRRESQSSLKALLREIEALGTSLHKLESDLAAAERRIRSLQSASAEIDERTRKLLNLQRSDAREREKRDSKVGTVLDRLAYAERRLLGALEGMREDYRESMSSVEGRES